MPKVLGVCAFSPLQRASRPAWINCRRRLASANIVCARAGVAGAAAKSSCRPFVERHRESPDLLGSYTHLKGSMRTSVILAATTIALAGSAAFTADLVTPEAFVGSQHSAVCHSSVSLLPSSN
jgi:hypothetical protein